MRLPLLVRRIRPAEGLTAAALGALGLLFVATPPPRPLRLTIGALPFHPSALILLVALVSYLLRMTALAARKTVATVKAVTTRLAAASVDDLSFAEERRVGAAAARLVRDCLPLYAAVVLYQASDFVVWRLRGTRTVDGALARCDQALFGVQASVWMEKFVTPGLTDLFSVFYFMHLVVVVGGLLVLHFTGPRPLFVEAMQGVVTTMVLGLLLYVAVPAVGPKYALAASYTRSLEGGALTDVNAGIMDAFRASRDVFPSLHVALSGLVLVYAWRARRGLGLLLGPLVLGNWISTIYLRYHYLVDVVAGALLAAGVYLSVRRWAVTRCAPLVGGP